MHRWHLRCVGPQEWFYAYAMAIQAEIIKYAHWCVVLSVKRRTLKSWSRAGYERLRKIAKTFLVRCTLDQRGDLEAQ
jgi:hypothetical protein